MAEIGAEPPRPLPDPHHARLLSNGYKTWFLAVLLIVSTFNFTDRFIFQLLAEAIKRDLQLSDFQLGALGGIAFALFYSIMGIPLARVAEHRSRVGLLSISIFIWSMMTALCGAVGNFWQMLLCRIGVGAGEASFTPAVNSLIGDHFPPTRRATAISIVQLGSPISALVGALIISVIVAHWDWRVAFFAAGLPGILVALLVWFGLREPPRGLADGKIMPKGKPPPLSAVLRTLMTKRAAIHIIVGGSLAHIGLTAIGSFLSPFYMRVHELSLREAAVLFGFMQAGAAALGLLISGVGSDWAASRDRRWHAWAPALALFAAAPLFAAAFVQPELRQAAFLIFPGSVVLFIYLVPTYAMLQNMVEARMRASAVAIYALISSIVGGLGPMLFGFVSDRFAAAEFAGGDFMQLCKGGTAAAGTALDLSCRAAAAHGLQLALAAGMIIFVWASAHYLLAARTLRRDSE
ncbi:MAG TPA: MFS transporter [Allosphingosinicella sp.]|nr:MFS transporter [Allosphingosinicella sp.]